MSAIHSLGIDVGSTTIKIVGLDAAGEMIWHMLEQAEPRVEHQIEQFLAQAKEEASSLNVIPLVSTGYGRKLVKQANRQVTEITCHARGIFPEFPRAGTLVDIGGQDSKVISISSTGKVVDFMMNDKCAAGTGRFLENTSNRLGVPLERMGDEALSVSEEYPISSTCTVFAESEIISLLANGISVAAILRGLHRSLVKRIVAMIRTVGIISPIMFSGGVVKNPAITQLLEEETGEDVVMPKHPQLMGAYGAALIALELAD
jgi:predicted CoA-substrate-specific enzyme activase